MPRTTETIPASKGRATIIAFAPRPPQISDKPGLQNVGAAELLETPALQAVIRRMQMLDAGDLPHVLAAVDALLTLRRR